VSAIAGAGTGLYSDSGAWFGTPEVFLRGNPLAGHLPGRRTTWNEGYVELGFGGATRLGNGDLYAFGAVTGMFSWSHGQDIFTDDDRGYVDLEKAYGGILHASPDDPKNHFKLSVGRQTFTLDDGFLINAVRGSSNAGERGGVYLGPRLTNDFSVLALGRRGAVGYNLFYIDPNELESLESDSTFLGANVSYDFGRRFTADATFLTIPTSKTLYRLPSGATVPREGLNTLAAHVKWLPAPDAAGVWLEGELAHQFNPGESMSAWAGYGSVGYIARGTQWTPSLSYRYAYFSGDDPTTEKYERYDPLLSTGLGIWLQGISFGKVTTNANLATHRVQLNAAPVETLNLTLDWYVFSAPERNNLGGNPALSELASNDLGQEVSVAARWAASRNLYLQALVSHAMPGAALRDIGADDAWTTLQLSLYGSF
jgi:hypothetical protein